MKDYRSLWTERVGAAVIAYAAEQGLEAPDLSALTPSTPPSSSLGDLAFPVFPLARTFRKAPAQIAEELVARLASEDLGRATAAGPYINVSYPRPELIASVLAEVHAAGDRYGQSDALSGERIMVEFSSPNTNKPLHLGHMRNDAIGESVSRILKAAGADVLKANLINDRGVHICKSMLAYRKFGEGKTPSDMNMKSDHFVGHFYVKFAQWAREDTEAESQAQQMLKAWEAGDPETVALWKRMNTWAVEGIEETYRATGISFDRVYRESETYKLGRDWVLKGLEEGVFYRDSDGSIWVDLAEIGLDRKVLLRGDGTSLYVTQDLGTAISRHEDYPFTRLIYVVGSEQQYHFRVLFHVLEKLGFEWATQLYHLSYGMVNLTDGRMKSREGTVVDADDLLQRLADLAAEEIREKGREDEVDDVSAVSRNIALAALNYYLLQTTPSRDMIFDPKESLSFTGNTGPYLQYMGARIQSMLRKAEGFRHPVDAHLDAEHAALLETQEEWDLVMMVAAFPQQVVRAATDYNPQLIAAYLYDLAKLFSRYYHDHPILNDENPDRSNARLVLTAAIGKVFRSAFELIGIPYLEKM